MLSFISFALHGLYTAAAIKNEPVESTFTTKQRTKTRSPILWLSYIQQEPELSHDFCHTMHALSSMVPNIIGNGVAPEKMFIIWVASK